MIFTDNTTNKTYRIDGNTVTQQRNGVTLAVVEMEDVAGWLKMMGFAPTVATRKARLVKNNSFEYGKQSYSVEAMDEATIDALVAALAKLGFKDECTHCQEDNGYDGKGLSMEYCVDATNEAEFKAAWKVAKKNVVG